MLPFLFFQSLTHPLLLHILDEEGEKRTKGKFYFILFSDPAISLKIKFEEDDKAEGFVVEEATKTDIKLATEKILHLFQSI